MQRGKELGYTLSDEQFKSVLDNIKKENKLESEEQFQAALKQEGMTLADLRKNLERQMIVQRVQQNEVLNKIGVTEDEARAYYDAHLNEFTTPPAVTLREILVTRRPDSRGRQRRRRRGSQGAGRRDSRARDRRRRAFEKLAADVSDSPSKANGGLIGPSSVNDLSADLRKMIEAMKIGDVTEPLRTAARLSDSEARIDDAKRRRMPFDQAREQISDRVLTDKRKAEFAKYLEKLRAQAIIEWKNEDIKKAYEEGLKQQAAAASATNAGGAIPTDRSRPTRAGSPSGRARATSRSSASSSSGRTIDAFLPTITRWSRWKDRKKKIDWPLFPGYCFARFDPEDALPDSEMHRRRQHRVVRRQAGADS